MIQLLQLLPLLVDQRKARLSTAKPTPASCVGTVMVGVTEAVELGLIEPNVGGVVSVAGLGGSSASTRVRVVSSEVSCGSVGAEGLPSRARMRGAPGTPETPRTLGTAYEFSFTPH